MLDDIDAGRSRAVSNKDSESNCFGVKIKRKLTILLQGKAGIASKMFAIPMIFMSCLFSPSSSPSGHLLLAHMFHLNHLPCFGPTLSKHTGKQMLADWHVVSSIRLQ